MPSDLPFILTHPLPLLLVFFTFITFLVPLPLDFGSGGLRPVYISFWSHTEPRAEVCGPEAPFSVWCAAFCVSSCHQKCETCALTLLPGCTLYQDLYFSVLKEAQQNKKARESHKGPTRGGQNWANRSSEGGVLSLPHSASVRVPAPE